MDERREPRFTTKTTATLRVLAGADLGACVTIINLSRSGLCAESPQFLRQGSVVSIQTERLTVVGKVKNCTEIRSGLFGIGIEIHEVVPLPDHTVFKVTTDFSTHAGDD